MEAVPVPSCASRSFPWPAPPSCRYKYTKAWHSHPTLTNNTSDTLLRAVLEHQLWRWTCLCGCQNDLPFLGCKLSLNLGLPSKAITIARTGNLQHTALLRITFSFSTREKNIVQDQRVLSCRQRPETSAKSVSMTSSLCWLEDHVTLLCPIGRYQIEH